MLQKQLFFLLAAATLINCNYREMPTTPTVVPKAVEIERFIAVTPSTYVIRNGQGELRFSITNHGNSVLTITDISTSDSLAGRLVFNWTRGQVLPGSSQPVIATVSARAGEVLSGQITVHGDQTGGNNTFGLVIGGS